MIADILIISSSYNLICSSIMFEANNFMDLCTGFFSLKGTVNLNPYKLCLQLPLFLLLYISFHCQQSVSSVVLPPRHLTLLCFSWVLHSPSPPIATSHSVSSHWNGEKGGFLCLDFFKCKIGQYKYFFFFLSYLPSQFRSKAGWICMCSPVYFRCFPWFRCDRHLIPWVSATSTSSTVTEEVSRHLVFVLLPSPSSWWWEPHGVRYIKMYTPVHTK